MLASWRAQLGALSSGLSQQDWRSRHLLLTGLLALHLPLLVLGQVLAKPGLAAALPLALLVLASLAGALAPGSRWRREVATTLGLMLSGVAFLALSDGVLEAELYLLALVVLITLYGQWAPLLLAVPLVLAAPVLVGLLPGDGPAGLGESGSGWLRATAGFLLAVVLAHLLRISAAAARRQQEDIANEERREAERALDERIREARAMREDLIAIVSHEFRTPLTAIQGNASTLRAHADRLPQDSRDALLAGILEHGARLSGLLEDMLTAASAASPDAPAAGDVSGAMGRLAAGRVAGVPAGAGRLSLHTEPALAAVIAPRALDQMFAALVAHGRASTSGDGAVDLRAAGDGDAVELLLCYQGSPEQAAALLEPFGSRENARTGAQTSLGLYVVRRLAEVHGGSVAVTAEHGTVEIRVRLRRLALETPGAPRTLNLPPSSGDRGAGGASSPGGAGAQRTAGAAPGKAGPAPGEASRRKPVTGPAVGPPPGSSALLQRLPPSRDRRH